MIDWGTGAKEEETLQFKSASTGKPSTESLNRANIDVNGSYFGSVANGSACYRDVPPGHYYIAPVSYNRDSTRTRLSILPASSST
jgi:hypothetical protein